MSRRIGFRVLVATATLVVATSSTSGTAGADLVRQKTKEVPPALIVFSSTPEAFGGAWDLWSVEPDGSNLRQLTDDAHWDAFPSLSPDRRFVAWERTPMRAAGKAEQDSPVQSAAVKSGKSQIFVMDLVKDKVRPLLRGATSGRAPAFSPDGRKIAFVSDRDGPTRLWVVNADGTGLRRVSPTTAAESSRPAWGEDGSYIVFAGYPRGEDASRLFQVGADGDDERELGDVEASEPAVSPDGSRLAAFSEDDVYIVDGATGDGTAVQHDGSDAYQPAWSPDGRELVFVQNSLGHSELVIYNLNTGSLRLLTVRGGPRGHKADEAPSWR